MKILPEHPCVVVGGGLAGGLVARQLARRGLPVLVLERGGERHQAGESRLPSQRDELRWAVRGGLMQDAAVETYTLRRSRKDRSHPLRRLQVFLPGTGVGGAATHWNGQSFRWNDYNFGLRTRLEQRYGRGAIPDDMPLQDWGVGHDELEPSYDLFEKLFGVAGKAGNLRGVIQPGGNPLRGAAPE